MENLQGTTARRTQLDKWMDERRQELRLRWAHVAERAGMTTPNLLRIRKGKISISWDAADGIEYALGWAKGSVEAAVLHGKKPTLDPGGPMPEIRPPNPEPTIDGLPEEERAEFLTARKFMRGVERELTVRSWLKMGEDYQRLRESSRTQDAGRTE